MALNWDNFIQWARTELAEHATKVDSYYHVIRHCGETSSSLNPKRILVVGCELDGWIRAVNKWVARDGSELWAAGPDLDEAFAKRHESICRGTVRCETDVWSPGAQREQANIIGERGFDLILAVGLIEHVYHPEWVFKVLRDCLTPQGRLVIAMPNAGRFGTLLALMTGRGLNGDLDRLLPANPLYGKEPVREYVWRELSTAAHAAGLETIAHDFYQTRPSENILSSGASPLEEAVGGTVEGAALLAEMQKSTMERKQLLSDFHMTFRRKDSMPWWWPMRRKAGTAIWLGRHAMRKWGGW